MPYHETDSNANAVTPEQKRGYGCIHFMAPLLIVFAISMAIIPFAIRKLMEYKFDPSLVALIEEAKTKPVTVPQEWREVKPFPDDLRDNVHKLISDWDTIRSLARVSRAAEVDPETTRSEEEWTSISLELGTCFSVLSQAESASKHPYYDLEIAYMPEYEIYSSVAAGAIYQVSRLLLLDAQVLSRAGKYSDALDRCLTVLRLSRRHPASRLNTHHLGMGIANFALENTVAAASQCHETSSLQHMLSELNKLQPQFKSSSLDQVMLIDPVGQLRMYAREGYPVRYENRRPVAFYMDQTYSIRRSWRQWQLEHLSPLDPYTPRRRAYLEGPAATKRDPDLDHWSFRLAAAFGTKDILYSIMLPDVAGPQQRSKITAALYDLTRLYLRKRIAILDGEPDTTATAHAVLRELQCEDPFATSSTMKISSNAKFYSTGPDLYDDRGLVVYDLRHGLGSPGDIVVEP